MTNRFTRGFFGGGPWTTPRMLPVGNAPRVETQRKLGQADPRVSRLEKNRSYAQGVIRNFDVIAAYIGREEALRALDQAENAVIRAERDVQS